MIAATWEPPVPVPSATVYKPRVATRGNVRSAWQMRGPLLQTQLPEIVPPQRDENEACKQDQFGLLVGMLSPQCIAKLSFAQPVEPQFATVVPINANVTSAWENRSSRKR